MHALAKSPKLDKLWCAPGNGGIAAEAECVEIKATDIPAMVLFAKEHDVDYVVVAPDDPLALVWWTLWPKRAFPLSVLAKTPPSLRPANPFPKSDETIRHSHSQI